MPEVGRKADKNHTQSVILYKDTGWTERSSRKWCSDHNYYTDGMDETKLSYRFRQYDPDSSKFDYRTVIIQKKDGKASIELIYGYLKEKKAMTEPEVIERRYLEIDVRAAEEGKPPVISGMAAVYNQETVIGEWFREVIRSGAFQRVLSENPDVVGAPNHNWDVVLGRTTAGTLKLEDRENAGLHYDIMINPDDQEAMNFYSRVQRGDIRHSSFAFTVRKEQWTNPPSPKELALREVIEIDQLFDVSPVTFPAYPTTTAVVRSKAEAIKQELEQASQAASDGAEGEAKAKEAARRKRRGRILQMLDHKP
jgi:HK97 family phage prohead protease